MVQYRDGDVIIGVLVSVHSRGSGQATCNQILSGGVEEVETINLVVDKVSLFVDDYLGCNDKMKLMKRIIFGCIILLF